MESTIITMPERITPDRTPFIGRYRELSMLLGELEGGNRLLTITGPSGMGKTRLAKVVMGEAAPSFIEGGAWFSSLISIKTGDELEAAVARGLGIPEKQGRDLSLALANRGRMLLVLDNLDDVVAQAAPLILDWLDHCAELQILVTSIVPLGIVEETRFELGPLQPRDAINLYIERANRAWAGTGVPEQEAATLEELVGRLDRIPLAIELAAARVRILSPQALLSRIDHRFELLSSPRPGRHGSLLKALSLTFDLLSEEEKLVLARTSVFAGGFSLEAAEAILSPEASHRALDLVDGLRSKALLQVEEGEPARFSAYESVGEFAAIQLEALGERDECVARHAIYFLREGERHVERTVGRDPAPSLRWLQKERKNLIAAHRRCLGSDPDTAARLGLILSAHLLILGPAALEEDLLDSTVGAAKRASDPVLLARALWARAMALTRVGRLEEAREDLRLGLERARSAGAKLEESRLLILEGAHLSQSAAFERGADALDESFRLAQELDSPIQAGIALLYRGRLEESRANHEEAAEHYGSALAIFHRQGAVALKGTAHFAMGVAWASRNEVSKSRRALAGAREIFHELGVLALEADAIMNQGGIEVTAGNHEAALGFLEEALELERRVGNRRFEGLTLMNLGILALDQGEFKVAEQRLGEALELLELVGDRRYCAECHFFLAVGEALEGRQEEAMGNLAEARSFFVKVGDPTGDLKVQVIEGLLALSDARVLERRSPGRKARELEEQAKAILERIGSDTEWTGETLIVARRILQRELQLGRTSDGREAAEEVRVLIGPGGSWFEVGTKRVDLHTRTAMRRILVGLAKNHQEAPGEGLGQEQLFEIGWLGERILPDAAAARVYVAVRTLRTLGLDGILVRRPSGYLLDPDARVKISQP